MAHINTDLLSGMERKFMLDVRGATLDELRNFFLAWKREVDSGNIVTDICTSKGRMEIVLGGWLVCALDAGFILFDNYSGGFGYYDQSHGFTEVPLRAVYFNRLNYDGKTATKNV